MTFYEQIISQIEAQKALMESKGATHLRLEFSHKVARALFDDRTVDDTDSFLGMPVKEVKSMEGFAILATWPEK